MLLLFVTTGPTVGYFDATVDNDGMGAGGDSQYTSGLALRYASELGDVRWVDVTAKALFFWMTPGRSRAGVTAGHAIYTPTEVWRADPDTADRPYAGQLWAEGSLWGERQHAGRAGLDDRSLTRLGFSLGVVGPASGARALQTAWHHMLAVEVPNGWDHQLKNELTVMLTGEYLRRFNRQIAPELEVDLMPKAHVSLGNLLTQASLSVLVRIGSHLLGDWGPSQPFFALIGSGTGFGWYVFAGVEGRAVAHDLLLDGNTFRESRRVAKHTFTGDFVCGAALTYWRVRVAYTNVLRSAQVKSRVMPHDFGSLSVTLAL